MTVCLLLGISFLGRATRRVRVLYLSLEMPTGEMRQRIRLICQDALRGTEPPLPNEASGFFFVGNESQLDLESDQGWETLEALLECSQADVVVIDSLHKVLVTEDRETVKAIYNRLVRFAQKGPAVLVLDQMSRSVASGRDSTPTAMASIETIYKGANANVILALRRLEDGRPPIYELGVAGHYHTLADPISLRWPVFEDGQVGCGWEVVSGDVAYGISRERLWQTFERHAERQDHGRLEFSTQSRLFDALIKERILEGMKHPKTSRMVPTSKDVARRRLKAIGDAYVFEHEDEPTPGYSERPIWCSKHRGTRAIRYVWCGKEDPGHDLFPDPDTSGEPS